jgi:Tfp pilus assembly protein PilN
LIKINLQQRKAAVGISAESVAQASTGLKSVLAKINSRLSSVDILGDTDKRALLLQIVVFAVITAATYWFLDEQKLKMLAEVDAEIAVIDSKISLLTSELNKTSGYEQIKKNLEADERTIRTKITTIQELIRDRTAPPKILTTLSESIPKDVWLREFSLKDRHFRLLGNATAMDVVSDFMKSLEDTIYFKTVVLKSSKQEVIKGMRNPALFELEADRR